MSGEPRDPIVGELDDVPGAVWLAAAALTYGRLRGRDEPVPESEAALRQVEIRNRAERICSKPVNSARTSQWVNADHADSTYNYLRAVGSKRRLTMPGEFDRRKERPDLPLGPNASVHVSDDGEAVTYAELIGWVEVGYPRLLNRKSVTGSAADKATSPVGTPSEDGVGELPASADSDQNCEPVLSFSSPAEQEPIKRLYRLLALLPRYDHSTPTSVLPENGMYFFFECGEEVQVDGWTVDRVVRVGTHRKDGNFRSRIRQHYGNRSDLGGNKNGSVFRKHVGGALLGREDPVDERLDGWLKQGGPSYDEVEAEVSRVLRRRFTFACVSVPDADERLRFERRLIGLLSGDNAIRTDAWPGRYAHNEKIRDSGLWNTQHTGSGASVDIDFDRLSELTARSSIRLDVGSTDTDRIVVVPCGDQKIWDADRPCDPVSAEEAYTSSYAKANRRYARHFGDGWLVLSAKYGLMTPRQSVPGDYDVSFARSRSGSVPVSVLASQADALNIDRFDTAVVLGGKDYRDAASRALEKHGLEIVKPLAGLDLFESMTALSRAVREDELDPT